MEQQPYRQVTVSAMPAFFPSSEPENPSQTFDQPQSSAMGAASPFDSTSHTGPRQHVRRRSTDTPAISWPGAQISYDQPEQCPECNALARFSWWGHNMQPPWVNDSHGEEILTYGQRPEIYEREVGPILYFTLCLWECIWCQSFWYNYLYTQDGRQCQRPRPTPQPKAPSAAAGHKTGATLPPPQQPGYALSPTSTLRADERSDCSAQLPSIAPVTAAAAHLNTAAAAAATPFKPRQTAQPAKRLPQNAANLPVSIQIPNKTNNPVGVVNRSSGNAGTAYGQAMATSPASWSPVDTRSSNESPPELNSATSPAEPAAGEGQAPAAFAGPRRVPTSLEPAPPPKKQKHKKTDPQGYQDMRKQMACDDCRRNKKKCDPSHTGPRRPWSQRMTPQSSQTSPADSHFPDVDLDPNPFDYACSPGN